MNPVLGVEATNITQVIDRGQLVDRKTYDLKVNRYFERGIIHLTLQYKEFEALQQWQNETGIQVIYPWVDKDDILASRITPTCGMR